MDPHERRRIGRIWFLSAAIALVGAAAIVVTVLAEPGPFARQDLVSVIAAGAVVVGLVALGLAWRADGQQLAATAEARDRLDAELRQREAELDGRAEQLEEAREDHREELRRRDEELHAERQARARLEQARRAERDWNRELREQIFRMHAEGGTLGEVRDVPGLVLRLALTLLEAEKGLLITVDHDAANRDLRVAASEGFRGDPRHSDVAQRFASQVLERDATVREDDRREIQAHGESTVDEEIESLVAVPIYVRDEFAGVVVCANRPGGFEEVDEELLLSLGDHAGAVLENTRLHGQLRASYVATVAMLAEAIQAKDPSLRGHSEQVSRYVAAVAEQLELEPREREELVFASLLHDVGKLGVSERVLLKPDALTPEEYSAVQLHPRIGYQLVQLVPALRPVGPAILYHHERYDGEGYPSRLKGDQIPLEARVVAVADSFSAMTTDRPYRAGMSVEHACEELIRCAGTQFDPEVVKLFVAEVRQSPPVEEEGPALDLLDDPELAARSDGEGALFGLAALERIDNLTLLYTHRHLHELAAKEAQRAEVQQGTFAVVLVELVRLEELNRREGYAAGDAAIRSAGRAVDRAAVRCGGTGARYSGRRLALLAPGLDQEAADALARDLAGEAHDGAGVRVGAAAWREGDSGDDVIARARSLLAEDPGDGRPERSGVVPAPGS